MTPDLIVSMCGQLRTAWGWLATTTIPGRAQRNQRPQTPAALKARNERAIQERGDKLALTNAGR
ncbi:MAG: hypothetical protein ABW156_02430, partial [Jiangellaceae bacterium]